MSEEKKDNPYVSAETCEAYRTGTEQRFKDLSTLIDEKIKGLKTTISVAAGVSTLIIMAVQFYLELGH